MKISKTSAYKALLALTIALGIQALPAMAGAGRSISDSVATAAPARSWVVLKASTHKKVYAVGQPVQVILKATNTFKRATFLQFTSGQRFDFSVYKAGTDESVYTWSATRMFIQALGSLSLKTGQSQTYRENIGDEMGQLPPGKYRLVARLANSPRPIVAAPIQFEIAAPTLAVTARTDKTTYKVGEEVRINVAVTNRLKQANRANIQAGMITDFFVSDETGMPVWNRLANLRFIRILGNTNWKVGETKNFAATWNGIALPHEEGDTTVRPGRYRVQGVLQTNPAVYSQPVYINIVP